MWFKIRQFNDDGRTYTRKFVSPDKMAALATKGEIIHEEAMILSLGDIIEEFDEELSDGEILDEIIKLIDEGECFV